ncbi:MAG: phosphatase PAP2 family protein [Ferruginibacter sp.]
MEHIINFDRSLFRLINYNGHNDLFDWLMPFMRNSIFWYPVYLFMFLLIVFNCKKNAPWLILFSIITVILTDQVSSTLIKHNFHRLRPCADELLTLWRRSLVGCPGNSSFTSSHASNHFGIAVFFFITLKKTFGNWMYLFFPWALLICYAQVYVGVHYPLDVICGAIVGCLLGFFTAYAYRTTIYKVSANYHG